MSSSTDSEPAAGPRKACYAAAKNKEHIVEVLKSLQPAPRRVFEVSSGTGEHAETFLSKLEEVEAYQPSECDLDMMDSIGAWTSAYTATKCRAPLKLDVTSAEDVEAAMPSGEKFDTLININMIHISPSRTTAALFELASRVLVEGTAAAVVTYGPYRVKGEMVESNVAFDQSLKARNSEWGVRDLEWVCGEAARSGFVLERTVEMPANNLTCIWRR